MDINMSEMNSSQLHHLTMGIYSNLMDDFNPSLQRLVSLGNSYVRAFQALADTSEAYFSALSNIGERAFNSVSSHQLGDVLIQISENQRRLTMELEGVFRWFSVEVLQQMDNNIRQDIDFISGSRKQYEMEVFNLERQTRRGTNHDYGEYVHFLRESYRVALLEEERRHRYLAEKHCGLLQSIAQLMNKMGGTLQRTADTWADEVNATREPEASRPASEYGSDYSYMEKREEFRQSREEQSLGRMPSRAPSPQGGVSRSRAESMGSVGGGEGGRTMRAFVDHHPVGSSPNVLPFSRGEMITVLVQQPKNGWLYGRADSSSRKGWFPASFVEAVDDFPRSSGSLVSSSSSMSSQLYQPRSSSSSSHSAAPPPPPPPPSSSSSQKHRKTQPLQKTHKKKAESHADNKGSEPQRSRPELFPRGTNPFATVKLKPTHTDDRSAPRLRR